jgi:uncharacterized protein YecE (DUF72 family)
VFSIKGPMSVVGKGVLAEAGPAVERFFKSGVLELSDKLGPVLWQLAPADAATLPASRPTVLAAQAYHIEERRASLEEIHWSSSADGDLGTGGHLRVILSPGKHRIRAVANGSSVEVSVQVE